MADEPWVPTSGWAGIAPPRPRDAAAGEPALRLELLECAQMATITARAGQVGKLGELIREDCGLGLPETGRASFGGTSSEHDERGIGSTFAPTVDLIWSAPGQWLAIAFTGRPLDGLAERLAGVAAVTDQSDARALVTICGTACGMLLAKGFSIDLHASAFPTGATATTAVAHIGVQIWRVDDTPTFVLSMARSFASSFWCWLTAAAAEFDYEVSSAGAQ